MGKLKEIEEFSMGTQLSVLKPWIAASEAHLEIAQLTQSIKWNLNSLVWESTITSFKWEYFNNPEVVKTSIRLQQKYDFQPLWNRTDFSYLTRVISIADFQEHPDLYFTKLTKWFGTFPLDLDLNFLAKNFLTENGLWFEIKKWILQFMHQWVISSNKEIYANLSHAFNKALIDSGCAIFHTEWFVYIDILTFLKNYDKCIDFVNGEITHESIKENALNSFASIRTIVLAILKTVTNITIKSPHDFFQSEKHTFEEVKEALLARDFSLDENNPFKAHNALEENIFLDIEKLLLSTAKWVSKSDIDGLIKIQHPEQFAQLVEMLIEKLLSDNSVKKTWINNLDKDISQYSTEEMIAFATYLARYLIDDYQKVEDMVEDVLMWFAPTSLKGKCTDYTGMSLHIINSYMKLKYPEKFKNIIVWYDAQNIWDSYKHCYMKVYGYNAAGLIEVTFIDPTKLAWVTMGDLEITDDIMTAMDASNLPIQIDRTAEDIIIAKIRWNSGENIQLSNPWSEVSLSQEEKKVWLLENQTNKLTLWQILKWFADRILSKIRN